MAGLAGISPLWYTMLESARDIRVSPQMLHRVSTALRLNDNEKAYLFSLAIDELPLLPEPPLRGDSLDVLAAFQSFHSLSKRLWASSTHEEALEAARACAWGEICGDVIATRTRERSGQWHYVAIGDDDALGGKVIDEFLARWGASFVDDIHGIGTMMRPGEVLTRAEQEHLFPDVGAKRRAALEVVSWVQEAWAMASIQSRGGFVSRLVVFHGTKYAYSHIERAKLATIADLTSLALS